MGDDTDYIYKGMMKDVFKEYLSDQNRENILKLMSLSGKTKEEADDLICLLESEDTMIRDEAISMFRKIGDVNSLLPLIFDSDNAVVQRIKRYINEA